jgi:exosortase family protein XrtF
MAAFSFQEFKPTILFLVKFLGLYVIGNLVYGWFVTAWYPSPDPVTHWVSMHSTAIVRMLGYTATWQDSVARPTTLILNEGKTILSVYEGCNGLNTVVVFLSFLLAFGPYVKKMVWFIPLGLLVIHVANLIRIVLLFLVAIYMPHHMYFTHKYLFTAFIYLFVFLLWVWWVAKLTPKHHA